MVTTRIGTTLTALLLASTPLSAKPVDVTFEEVTNLAAAISPDGFEAILDIQGILWRVSMGGGEASHTNGVRP